MTKDCSITDNPRETIPDSCQSMSMEADLSSILSSAQELTSGDADGGVVGMIVLDDRGLLVATEGQAHPEAVGLVQSVVGEAGKVQDDGSYPAIEISTQSQKYLIKREDKMTTALIKRI